MPPRQVPAHTVSFSFPNSARLPPNNAFVKVAGVRHNFYLDTRNGIVINPRLLNDMVAKGARWTL
jgi:hypothetical protein